MKAELRLVWGSDGHANRQQEQGRQLPSLEVLGHRVVWKGLLGVAGVVELWHGHWFGRRWCVGRVFTGRWYECGCRPGASASMRPGRRIGTASGKISADYCWMEGNCGGQKARVFVSDSLRCLCADRNPHTDRLLGIDCCQRLTEPGRPLPVFCCQSMQQAS